MQVSEIESARIYVPKFFWQIVAIHLIVAAVAPFYFSSGRLALALVTAMWFGHGLGIFHHMLLTHRSFKTLKSLEYFGAFLGTLSWRGPMAAPIRYVAMHRIHHIYSDKEQDPHSPIHSIWHSLLAWFWWFPQIFNQSKDYEKFAPELAKDPVLRFIERNVDLLQLIWGVLLFVGGGLASKLIQGDIGFDLNNAIGAVVYGVFVKSILVIYLSNLVDVINHTVGYRNYETSDTSTNSALLGMIHLGGAISWHNNHHAHPAYVKVKAKWWEIDVHFCLLNALEFTGLASDIKEFHEHESLPSKTKSEIAS